MLNLPEPKRPWNDMAKDPESESPGVKEPNKHIAASLASRLGLGSFLPRQEEMAEPEQMSDHADEEAEEGEGEDEETSFTGLMKTIRRNTHSEEDSGEPASNSPTIVEIVRPSAVAARRHLQRPPRNVNVTSHLSPSYAKTSDDSDDEAFPGPQPLPYSAGVARTPATADLRSRIEERIYDSESDIMELVDLYAEEKVKRDRKLYTPRQKTPMSGLVLVLKKTEYEHPTGALRVRVLLMPAIILLSRPSSLQAHDVEKGIRYARFAQEVARSEKVEEALEARCSYYIGLAAFLLLPKHALYVSNRPTSIGSQSELGKPETVQTYFEQACFAKGVYEEGTWAEEWVEYLKSPSVRQELSLSAEEERPTSSGSWGVSGWLNKIWGPKGQQANGVKQPPTNRISRRKDSAISQNTDSTCRPGGPERIPSFETWHSGDSRPSSSASSSYSRPSLSSPNELAEASSPITQPFSSPRPPPKAEEEPTLPPPVTSPSPQTSPRKRISFASLSNPVSSDSDTSLTSPAQWRGHRRRTSLIAMVTGRERRPSELEQAEEGDSPYRATFESMSEENSNASPTGRSVNGSEGMKKRRQECGA